MPLPGYKRIPGKASRYRTPDGGEISRRQYENIRFRKAGWGSWSEYQRTAKTKEYRRFVTAAADEKGVSPRTLKNPESDFNQLYLEAKRDDWKNDPEGPFADFLVFIGVRAPDADYNVGETP